MSCTRTICTFETANKQWSMVNYIHYLRRLEWAKTVLENYFREVQNEITDACHCDTLTDVREASDKMCDSKKDNDFQKAILTEI